jgi:hypothetical protein
MSPVTNTTATAAYIFKTDYAGSIGDTAMRMHPTLDRILKGSEAPGHAGDFVGSSFTYPMKFGNPQGVSNSFTHAQAQASASKGVQFVVTAKTKYGNVLVGGPDILKCADDGAFADLVTLTTDDTISAHVGHLAFDLFRTSSAIRGKRASISTNTVQLATIDDARNFEIDQTVGASPNADGSSPRTGTTTVTGVNLSLGQITLASAAAIASFSDNDFLFNAGDPVGQGTSLGSWNGMEDCTPLAAPSATLFRNVDRTTYVERLAGTRLPTATSLNQTVEESIGQAAILVNAVGGFTSDAVLNPINFWAVVRRGNARVEMQSAGGELKYGFERATISTPAGSLVLVSDPDCPIDRCRGFDRNSHYIRRNGELVHIINDDGNYNLRSTTADSIETRTRTLADYVQNNTRNHFVFQI